MRERSVEASRALKLSQAALEKHAVGRAVRGAWEAANAAVRADDEETLAAVVALASQLEEQEVGRERREVTLLRAYASHCLQDLRSGGRQRPILDRLLRRRPGPQTKQCPDCAETILAAANVCRFCGYRFALGNRKPKSDVP